MRATLSVAFFIFSKFSVSFLGQKRAVGKWGGYIVISKIDCFSDGCLVLGILDAYQLRKEICPHCPQNIFLQGGCFFRCLAAYHMKGFWQSPFRSEVMTTSATSKIFPSVGWLCPFKCPDMWKVSSSSKYISEISSPRVYKSTPESRN